MNCTIIMVSVSLVKTYIDCFHQYYLVTSTVGKLHFPWKRGSAETQSVSGGYHALVKDHGDKYISSQNNYWVLAVSLNSERSFTK